MLKDNELSNAPTSRVDRRSMLSAAGAGTVAMGALALAALPRPAAAQGINDVAIANFALNFEYLGAELYARALGLTLSAADTTGGNGAGSGGVIGGRAVTFDTPLVQQVITQFYKDELGHVRTLRAVLGANAIAEPRIDLQNSFAAIAQLAGLGAGFDPFANENNLLLASFSIEDVCVTALRGAAPLVQNRQILTTAAGFLAVEGYQAATARLLLFQRNLGSQTVAISNVRKNLSGANDDQGVINSDATANITPTDGNSLVFARNTRQILNIAYGAQNASSGGFFPSGANGTIR